MKPWIALSLLLAAASPAAADDGLCAVPAEHMSDVTPLPRLKAALLQQRALTILAIGGTATLGAAAGTPEATYPARLSVLMGQRFPGTTISVVNAGRGRETTRAMAERLAAALLEHRPNLVIWETGTVDAVRRIDLDVYGQALRDGLAAVRARGADAILMDFQYGRGASALIDFQPYLETLTWVADLEDVTVFHRQAMMQYWMDTGRLDLSATQRDKQQSAAAALYDCVARRLVDVIAQAAK